jgi:hypothetical protein
MSARDDWRGAGTPNLSKVPQHIRDALSEPVPVRDTEATGRLHLFHDARSSGLNIPNARMHARTYTPMEGETGTRDMAPKVQIDFVDYTGKMPIATAILVPEQALILINQLMRSYLRIGGPIEEINRIHLELSGPKTAFELNKYVAVDDNPDLDDEEEEDAG